MKPPVHLLNFLKGLVKLLKSYLIIQIRLYTLETTCYLIFIYEYQTIQFKNRESYQDMFLAQLYLG